MWSHSLLTSPHKTLECRTLGDAREPPAAEVLVSTDVCLRALEGRFRSMGLPLLINYDLPVRKVRVAAARLCRSRYCVQRWTCQPSTVASCLLFRAVMRHVRQCWVVEVSMLGRTASHEAASVVSAVQETYHRRISAVLGAGAPRGQVCLGTWMSIPPGLQCTGARLAP